MGKTIRGERVYLREMTPEDISDDYLGWFRDAKVTEFLNSRDFSHAQALAHLAAGREGNSYVMHSICCASTDTHIGSLKIGPILWLHRVSDLVTVIGRRDYWGKGYATEAIRLATALAFGSYGLRKLSAGIIEGNVGSLKAYTSAGFVVEGRRRGECLVAGVPHDIILIGCFNPAFFGAGGD